MVGIDRSAFNKRGNSIVSGKKREAEIDPGRMGTHEKSVNWDDATDGFWDMLLKTDLN